MDWSASFLSFLPSLPKSYTSKMFSCLVPYFIFDYSLAWRYGYFLGHGDQLILSLYPGFAFLTWILHGILSIYLESQPLQ